MSKFKIILSNLAIAILIFACNTNEKPGLIYNIEDFGAVGDSATINTLAIQKAVDEASKVGGTVLIPQGIFMTGTIVLKDHMTLEVSAKGKIIGSPNTEDYLLVDKAASQLRYPGRQSHHLIYANGAKNISITGKGVIDGNGYAFWEPFDELPVWIQHRKDPNIKQKSNRYYSNMVELVNCSNIYIRDITLQNTTEWTLHMFDCTDVLVDGLKIDNNLYGPNADGFDLSGCQNVRITNCNISTCDDGICIKTFPASRVSKNITVTNSVIRTSCAALKLGEIYKDISDITFSNCVVYESSRAFAIYARQGGNVSNINVSNIVANTNAPLVLNRPFQIAAWDIKDKKTGEVKVKGGDISNVTISNFLATTEGRALVTADDGHSIKNLTLRNISFNYAWIEDPVKYGDKATSGQFSGMNQAAKTANAAMVISGVEDLMLDNFALNFPMDNDSVPSSWQHPVRIENGSNNRHKPTYGLAKETELSALYIRDAKNVNISAPLARASTPDLNTLNIDNTEYSIIHK